MLVGESLIALSGPATLRTHHPSPFFVVGGVGAEVGAWGAGQFISPKVLSRGAWHFSMPPIVRRVQRTAVSEFRMLIKWAEEDDDRCSSVKKILKLTKGWEEARDHVLKVRR